MNTLQAIGLFVLAMCCLCAASVFVYEHAYMILSILFGLLGLMLTMLAGIIVGADDE